MIVGRFLATRDGLKAGCDLRRYLRRELALPAAQVALSGYWKRGTVAFDHHAPIDPEDPED